MLEYQYVSSRMAVFVGIDLHGRVIEAAPIVAKFIGQPAINLENWMRRQGGFIKHRLNSRIPERNS